MNKSKSLSKFVLLMLEKSVDGVVRLNDFLQNPGFYAYGSGWDYPLKKSAISKTFKRLRENGYVDFIGDDQLILRLTDFGRNKALWIKMKESVDRWDGKWRLVFWDIPEERKAIRNVLRSKLKQLGFVMWQKSVWASKKNCTELLRNFIKSVGVEEWVFVVESDNVERNVLSH